MSKVICILLIGALFINIISYNINVCVAASVAPAATGPNDDLKDMNDFFKKLFKDHDKEINKIVKELFPEIYRDDFSMLKKNDRKLLFRKIRQKGYSFFGQINKSINIVQNSIIANVKNIEKNYIIINDNIIDYIDRIKVNKNNYGIRILNFHTNYPHNSILNLLIKAWKESEKDKIDISKFIKNMENVYDLSGLYTNIDLITLKYEKNINDNFSFGFLSNINTNQNLLISGLNLNFNYSLGAWLGYHINKIKIDLNKVSIDNNFKLGFIFTQKFLEKKLLEFFSDEKNKNKLNFYNTHNINLFLKVNFYFDIKKGNYLKYLADRIELNNITNFSYFYFKINNLYINNETKELMEDFGLDLFGSYHYFRLENEKRIKLLKKFNMGRHFFISIPYGIDIRYDLLNFGKKILSNAPNSLEIENLYNKRKILEFFAGLNIGIFGKTIEFEFSNTGIKLNFLSKF